VKKAFDSGYKRAHSKTGNRPRHISSRDIRIR
jgi:hypothetical protein